MKQFMILSLVAAALLLAGCGTLGGGRDTGGAAANPSGSAGPGGGPSAEDIDSYRRFARCMREHGVPVPDPEPGGGFGGPSPRDTDPVVRAGFDACGQLLPNGGALRPPVSPEELDRARAYSRCMREHGVNFPDPEPDGSVVINSQDSVFDPEDPAVAEAADACQAAATGGAK